VLGGTGAYATTSGSGSGTGSPLDNNPDGVLDVYDGALVG
jgi:hypothetical protein